MRYPSARFLRPLLALALLVSAATVVEAQQANPATSSGASLTLTPEQRAVYVGVYAFSTPEGPRRLEVYESGDRLMGRPDGDDEPSPLTPVGEHRFRPEVAREAVVTFTVEDGRATRLTIVFPDERGTVVASRVPS
jgi:hypothetical protein